MLKGEGCSGIKRQRWRPDQCEYVPTSAFFPGSSLIVMSSHGCQRIKVLYRYVHASRYILLSPPADFDVIVRPLPSVLYNLDALISRKIGLVPNCQAQFLCSTSCKLIELALGEHVIISFEHLARFFSTLDLRGRFGGALIFLCGRVSLSFRFLCCKNPRHKDILTSVSTSWILTRDYSF